MFQASHSQWQRQKKERLTSLGSIRKEKIFGTPQPRHTSCQPHCQSQHSVWWEPRPNTICLNSPSSWLSQKAAWWKWGSEASGNTAYWGAHCLPSAWEALVSVLSTRNQVQVRVLFPRKKEERGSSYPLRAWGPGVSGSHTHPHLTVCLSVRLSIDNYLHMPTSRCWTLWSHRQFWDLIWIWGLNYWATFLVPNFYIFQIH